MDKYVTGKELEALMANVGALRAKAESDLAIGDHPLDATPLMPPVPIGDLPLQGSGAETPASVAPEQAPSAGSPAVAKKPVTPKASLTSRARGALRGTLASGRASLAGAGAKARGAWDARKAHKEAEREKAKVERDARLSPQEKTLRDTRDEYALLRKRLSTFTVKMDAKMYGAADALSGRTGDKREFASFEQILEEEGGDEYKNAKEKYLSAKLAYAETLGTPEEKFGFIEREHDALHEAQVGGLSKIGKKVFLRGKKDIADFWLSRGIGTRRGISIAIGVAIGVSRGTVNTAHVPMYIISRLIGGAAAAYVGQKVGQFVEQRYGQEEITKEFNAQKTKLTGELSGGDLTPEKITRLEEEYAHSFKDFSKERRRRLAVKGAAMLTASFVTGTSMGVGFKTLETAMFGSGASIPETPPRQPSAKVPPGRFSEHVAEKHGSKVPGPVARGTPTPAGTPVEAATPKPVEPAQANASPTPEAKGTPRIPDESNKGGATPDKAVGGKETVAAPAEPAKPKTVEAPARSEAGATTDPTLLGNKEGIWHPVKRQLDARFMADQDGFLKKYNEHAGEHHWKQITAEELKQDTTGALKQDMLNRETAKILVKEGFIKPDGTETWIKHPGVKILLGTDDKIEIEDKERVVYEHKTAMLRSDTPEEITREISKAETISPQEHTPATGDLAWTPRRVDFYEPAERGNLEDILGTDLHRAGMREALGKNTETAEEVNRIQNDTKKIGDVSVPKSVSASIEFSGYGKTIARVLGIEQDADMQLFADGYVSDLLNAIPDQKTGLDLMARHEEFTLKTENGEITFPINRKLIAFVEAVNQIDEIKDFGDIKIGELFREHGKDIVDAYVKIHGTIEK
jgi:hypothetical protein